MRGGNVKKRVKKYRIPVEKEEIAKKKMSIDDENEEEENGDDDEVKFGKRLRDKIGRNERMNKNLKKKLVDFLFQLNIIIHFGVIFKIKKFHMLIHYLFIS